MPSSYAKYALVGAGLLGTVFAWYRLREEPRVSPREEPVSAESRPREPGAARDDSDVQGDLRRLRAQVAGLQNELAARKEAEDGAAAERAEATPTDARSVAEQREEADRQWREHMTQVAASFDSEPANPAWSQATQGAVEAAIQRDPVLRERAGDITCKSHTCRMTVTRDPGGSVDKQMPVFAQSLGGVLPSVQADNTVVDGQPQYTLYLSDVRPVAANRAAN